MHQRHTEEAKRAFVFARGGTDLVDLVRKKFRVRATLGGAESAHAFHDADESERPHDQEHEHDRLGDEGEDRAVFPPAERSGAQEDECGHRTDYGDESGDGNFDDGAAFAGRARLVEIRAEGENRGDESGRRRDEGRERGRLGEHPAVCGGGDAGGFGGRGDFRQRGEDGEREHAARCAAFERAFDEGEDLLLQDFTAAGEALFDVVFGEIERGCDVFDGAVFAVVENERLAVIFGNALERAPHEGLLFVVRGEVGSGLIVGRKEVGGIVDRLGLSDGLASIGAAQVADFETQDPAEPGTEFFGLAQGGELAPGVDEGVLGEVFALAELTGGGVGEGAEEALVAFDDLAEGATVAGERRGDEFGVGRSQGGNHGIGGVHVMGCFYVPEKGGEVTGNLNFLRRRSGKSENGPAGGVSLDSSLRSESQI